MTEKEFQKGVIDLIIEFTKDKKKNHEGRKLVAKNLVFIGYGALFKTYIEPNLAFLNCVNILIKAQLQLEKSEKEKSSVAHSSV